MTAEEEKIKKYKNTIRRLQRRLKKKESRKLTVRRVNLDTMMRIDGNLHKFVIETLINARQWWANADETVTSKYTACPLCFEAVQYTSRYMNFRYKKKEDQLKSQFNFKQDKE